MEERDSEHPLRVHTAAWEKVVSRSDEYKRAHFDNYAEEGMDFYTGGENAHKTWDKWMSGDKGVTSEEAGAPDVGFHFCLARVAELVQIYGPNLYHRNPTRTVTPRQLPEIPIEILGNPQDPQVQQQHQMMMQAQGNVLSVARARAKLIETYLNFTPNELDLKRHVRRSIDETLIKGMGVLWTEAYQPVPGQHTLIGSFYDTIDNLGLDPDAEEFEDCQFIYRRCTHPVWKVARDYGLDEDYLREHATIMSVGKTARNKSRRSSGDRIDKEARSNDLITYYKIYSRMGMGDRLSGVDKKYRGTLDSFGDNVYLVVAKGIPYPLNLPSDLLLAAASGDEEAYDEAFQRVQWPIPYWLDGKDSWPCTMLYFHTIPNNVWPMAHIRPGMPELKFMNWTMSFLADNARHTSRVYALAAKQLDGEVKDKLTGGGGFEVVELSATDGKLNEQFDFKSPPNGAAIDLYQINAEVSGAFDKRTGLSELMYAMPGGMRSATEAEMKENARNVRPDDMANKVEDWMSRVARKEALAAQWLLDPEDVAPVLGPAGAQLWEQLIATADIGAIAMEFDYRIEAGSARKPNKDAKIGNMQAVMQVVMPLIVPYAQQTGDVRPVNAFIRQWAEANDIQDWQQLQLSPPPPPQPDPAMQQKMHMEQMKLQAEMQKLQAEMQLKGMDAQAKQLDMAIKQMALQFEQASSQQKLQAQRNEMVLDAQRGEQELRQDAAEHMQKMEQVEEQALLKLELDRRLANAKVQAAKTPKPAPKGK